jgi:hypothetical protein
VVGLSQSYDDDEHQELRDGGLSSPREIDGRVWAPSGAGQTTAGTPIWATQESNQVMHWLHWLRRLGDAELRAMVNEAGGVLNGAERTFVPESEGDSFRLREITTGAVIWKLEIPG